MNSDLVTRPPSHYRAASVVKALDSDVIARSIATKQSPVNMRLLRFARNDYYDATPAPEAVRCCSMASIARVATFLSAAM